MEILKTKDEFYIEEVLDSVREQINIGRVKSIPAFTVKAIENDYRAKKSKYDIEKNIEKSKWEKTEHDSRIIRELLDEFHRETHRKAENAFAALSEDEKKKFVRKFESEIIVSGNNFIKNGFFEKGIGFPGVKPIFRGYIKDKLLPKEDREFEEWAGKRGYKVVAKDKSKGEYELI
jgi:hypothetical protein